jgi:hypothetical protein
VERWENFRESWDRYHGMDIASKKIQERHKNGTINVGARLLLTQGIDSIMGRMNSSMQNFAVTAALFNASEVGFFLNSDASDLPYAWLCTCLTAAK